MDGPGHKSPVPGALQCRQSGATSAARGNMRRLSGEHWVASEASETNNEPNHALDGLNTQHYEAIFRHNDLGLYSSRCH